MKLLIALLISLVHTLSFAQSFTEANNCISIDGSGVQTELKNGCQYELLLVAKSRNDRGEFEMENYSFEAAQSKYLPRSARAPYDFATCKYTRNSLGTCNISILELAQFCKRWDIAKRASKLAFVGYNLGGTCRDCNTVAGMQKRKEYEGEILRAKVAARQKAYAMASSDNNTISKCANENSQDLLKRLAQIDTKYPLGIRALN